GGNITLRAGNAVLEDVRLRLFPQPISGEFVEIAVTDTGCGMTPEVLERTFERHSRSEEHTSELQSRENLVCRLLLAKKKKKRQPIAPPQHRQARPWRARRGRALSTPGR